MVDISKSDVTKGDISKSDVIKGDISKRDVIKGDISKSDVIFDNILMFYSKSADKKPGLGAHEKGNPNDFIELGKIKDWRKKLSNFFIAPMKIDGLTYNSVEHYFHSYKFWRDNPDFARTFTIESKSEWSKDPAFAKGVAGKTGKFKGKKYRSSDIKMRDDFYTRSFESKREFYKNVMIIGLYNKFAQHPELRKLLLTTCDAELWHLPGRNKSIIRVYELENVRSCFQKIKIDNYPIMDFKYFMN